MPANPQITRWLWRSAKCLGVNVFLYFLIFLVMPMLFTDLSPGACVQMFYLFITPVPFVATTGG